MGLWYIVAMHEPINDSGGDPFLLDAHRYGGGRWLHAYRDGLAAGGVVAAGSRSPCRKSVLKTKVLWTSVFSNLVLSPHFYGSEWD